MMGNRSRRDMNTRGAEKCEVPESGNHGTGATKILQGGFAEETSWGIGKGLDGQFLTMKEVGIIEKGNSLLRKLRPSPVSVHFFFQFWSCIRRFYLLRHYITIILLLRQIYATATLKSKILQTTNETRLSSDACTIWYRLMNWCSTIYKKVLIGWGL